MGCVQAKPSPNSPPRGLHKIKSDHGYATRALPKRPPIRAPSRANPPPDSTDGGDSVRGGESDRSVVPREEERRVKPPLPPQRPPAAAEDGETVDGWPRWLTENIPPEVLAGLVPRSADSYDKLDKIGQGTYSNVYKARDRDTGKIVALKKVRFDTSESESVRFMAREIMILQKLDHPNVIKLEGLATSRMQYSLYLVFDFMVADLSRVISRPDARLTEPQVKCYMQQLLSGLQHCHERGILHRDIKGSNLLIDRSGMLKIADFGLANYFNPNKKRPLTSRVVTLWYRAPELLLGTTDYGVGIDLWSAGCLLAEMFAGRPVMPGRTEVEQLHRIFKLCGSPTEEYWKKLKLSTSFRPPQPYKPSILETFKDFPSSCMSSLTTLLALDPSHRGSAVSALQNEFFTTSPLACDLSGLPLIYKEENEESNQHRDRRKRKKLKQRSRTQREGQKKTEESMGITKGDSGSSREEKGREVAYPMPSPSAGSRTGSTRYSVSPSLSPVASPPRDLPTRRSDSHPSASRNIKNSPLVATSGIGRGKKESIENMRRHGLEKRSSSTSAFRRPDANQSPEQYALQV